MLPPFLAGCLPPAVFCIHISCLFYAGYTYKEEALEASFQLRRRQQAAALQGLAALAETTYSYGRGLSILVTRVTDKPKTTIATLSVC